MATTAYAVVKRALDAAVSGLLLVLCAPLALVVLAGARRGLVPRLGSVVCIGRGGRPFALRVELAAPVAGGLAQPLGGSVLARWPALLAVLAGHASLVGPRILDAGAAAALELGDRDRFAVRPGLVCYWWLQQRANIDFGTEGDADRRYVAQRSLAADLSILMRALVALPYGRPERPPRAVEHIAGIRLLNLGMDELVGAIMTAAERRVRTRVAFVNPDCVNIAARDPLYRAALAGTDWVCPDGIGMKIAGRMLARPIRQNLNGTDLFPRLCAALAGSGHRVYLLGARPGVAAAVARWARRNAPGIKIAGCRSGYFTPDEEAAVIDGIRRSRADILLVAMGAPRQELWLRRHLDRTGASVGIGVGGLFDFYSGRIPRAPLWLREIGGEWVYRLLQEPRRMWRRYLVGNGLFLWRIARERMAGLPAAGGSQ